MATLFKTHEYSPCKRILKRVLQGEGEFSNATIFCVIFKLGLLQTE